MTYRFENMSAHQRSDYHLARRPAGAGQVYLVRPTSVGH